MTTLVEQAMAALQNLPADRRDELAQVIIDASMPTIQYDADQLAKIDKGLASADAGRFATDDQVAAAFAKFRAV